MPPALLDTDTLSEVMKGRDPQVQRRARQYLASYGCFTFSIITRYEILRGLKAKGATRQIATFRERCSFSAHPWLESRELACPLSFCASRVLSLSPCPPCSSAPLLLCSSAGTG